MDATTPISFYVSAVKFPIEPPGNAAFKDLPFYPKII